MMRPVRLIGAVLLLAVSSIPPTATARQMGPLGPPAADLLGLKISPATRPADDAVILFRGVAITFDPEGRLTRRVRLVERLLSDRAIEERGDPRVAFDTTRQELSIDVCRTFMRDGREVPATPHAFNRVTPERVASCPDRCGLQEMVISYLGLERGCMTELDYTLKDRVPWRPWAEGIEYLGDAAPVLQGEIRIAAEPLQTAFVGIPEPRGGLPGTWTYGPVPGFPDEGGIKPRERLPHLVYSTCPSWGALAGWIRARCDEAARPDSALRIWAKTQPEGGRPPIDDREMLRRIARLIEERTNGADDSPLSWWLPIRPAARTFDTSCGNLLDRAALAWASLRACGIEAHPRLVLASPTMEPPALSLFDDIRFDTDHAGSLSVERGTAGFATDDPAWGTYPLDGTSGPSGGVSVVTSDLSIRIHEEDDGSVRGEASVRIHRESAPAAGFDDIKGFLQDLASSYAEKGELAGFRVDELYKSGVEATFSFTGKGLGDSLGDDRRLIRIPSAPGMPADALPDGLSLRRRVRATPIVFPFASAVETVRLRLELSRRSRVEILPSADRRVGPGTLLETRVERNGETILISRRFEITPSGRGRTIGPEEYSAFRAVALLRTAPSAGCVVINRRME